jgi:hypothetical protein
MRTHTFVTLTVPPIVYLAIRELLIDAGYDHAFVEFGSEVSERIDMHGIALKMERVKGGKTDASTTTTD